MGRPDTGIINNLYTILHGENFEAEKQARKCDLRLPSYLPDNTILSGNNVENGVFYKRKMFILASNLSAMEEMYTK